MAMLEFKYPALYITQRTARWRRFYFLAQATEHIPNSLMLRKYIDQSISGCSSPPKLRRCAFFEPVIPQKGICVVDSDSFPSLFKALT